MIGIHPDAFSLRQLVWMTEGRDRAERYYLAWALSEAFGDKKQRKLSGSSDETEQKLVKEQDCIGWSEFKKLCRGYN